MEDTSRNKKQKNSGGNNNAGELQIVGENFNENYVTKENITENMKSIEIKFDH